MDSKEQLNLVKRIKAISETGLVYATDLYARERYEELKEISLKLMAYMADSPMDVIKDFFMPEEDYPTPKVDVRGFVLNDRDEILMAKESVDSKWTIPGGWADIGSTPSEIAVKEIEEETGVKTDVVRLLAVYDKQVHPHPPEPYYIYKLIFLCRMKGGELKAGFDMLGADFFPIEDLPELSEERILESQVKHLFQLTKSSKPDVYFD
ncbi:ADP-ribose pyrophosphatase [Flagellimonas aquimarina]|jgi:ADP-ribose pyrophosphatase YjhB (NUDIX family)|uniref:ADP-ribose pyrophosphatase n=1 Tax=Flagellimonas aquimarina TaxID=2201895 RepID=A0A316LJ26_9FLAO|nr:NUDIX hydrolase [Allomuricauda koreensis]PWL40110.1 ADP-ribose pyrophosphatase [Allomuricauda koreensis]